MSDLFWTPQKRLRNICSTNGKSVSLSLFLTRLYGEEEVMIAEAFMINSLAFSKWSFKKAKRFYCTLRLFSMKVAQKVLVDLKWPSIVLYPTAHN